MDGKIGLDVLLFNTLLNLGLHAQLIALYSWEGHDDSKEYYECNMDRSVELLEGSTYFATQLVENAKNCAMNLAWYHTGKLYSPEDDLTTYEDGINEHCSEIGDGINGRLNTVR